MAKKKQTRQNPIESKLKDSMSMCQGRVDRYKSYANKAGIAFSTMIAAAFTTYWAHFQAISENRINLKILQIVDQVIEIDNKIGQKQNDNNGEKERLIQKRDLKIELIDKVGKIYQNNPILIQSIPLNLHYHIHIYLIIGTLWGLIAILVWLYLFYMRKIAEWDKLHAAYDRLLAMHRLKIPGADKEIYDLLKSGFSNPMIEGTNKKHRQL